MSEIAQDFKKIRNNINNNSKHFVNNQFGHNIPTATLTKNIVILYWSAPVFNVDIFHELYIRGSYAVMFSIKLVSSEPHPVSFRKSFLFYELRRAGLFISQIWRMTNTLQHSTFFKVTQTDESPTDHFKHTAAEERSSVRGTNTFHHIFIHGFR